MFLAETTAELKPSKRAKHELEVFRNGIVDDELPMEKRKKASGRVLNRARFYEFYVSFPHLFRYTRLHEFFDNHERCFFTNSFSAFTHYQRPIKSQSKPTDQPTCTLGSCHRQKMSLC